MKIISLEEYIKKRVADTAAERRSPVLGRSSLTAYSDAVGHALNLSKRIEPKHGTRAEALGDIGLSFSGYADYIGTRAKKTMTQALDTAYREKAESEAGELIEYNVAREETEQLMDERTNDIIAYARRGGITDYDEIYREAISMGFGESWAKNATELAIDAAKSSIRVKNMEIAREFIISKRLTRQQAYNYALSLGLAESDAVKLGELAYQINQYVGEFDEDESIPDIEAPPETTPETKPDKNPPVIKPPANKRPGGNINLLK